MRSVVAILVGFVSVVALSLGTDQVLHMRNVALRMNLGPVWYPVALMVTTLPCAWLGGVLHRNRHS